MGSGVAGVSYDLSNYCLRRDTETFSPGDDTYFYYRLENDSLNFIGDWADNGVSEKWFYSFSNLRTDLIFPFTYNDSHIDTFESSYNDMSGSGWHYQSGSTEVFVDGYGEIITPDGNTIYNTVRVKEPFTVTGGFPVRRRASSASPSCQTHLLSKYSSSLARAAFTRTAETS